MKIKFLLPLPVLLCCTLFLQAQDTTAFKTVSVKALDSLFSNEPVFQVIDVRTDKEYTESHLKSALHMDVNHKKFLKRFKAQFPSKEITYVVYCKSGGRSVKASNILTKAGYKVINLKEGIKGMPEDVLWISPSNKIQNIPDTTKSSNNQ
jgi:rhodanese-related sulfurtransferase